MTETPGRPEDKTGLKRKSPTSLLIALLCFFQYALPVPASLFAATTPDKKIPNRENNPDVTILNEFENKSLPAFHVPDALKTNINFWIDVYSKYLTNEVVIHDSRHLNIIFEVLKVSEKADTAGAYLLDKSIERRVNLEKERYKKILESIQTKVESGESLGPAEKKIVKLYRHIKGSNKFLLAAARVRGQPGMRERFLEGIKRSGLFIDKMKEIFREYGLPTELTVLPHIESLFNHTAYSSVGAAGIWQFMRTTGSMYMKIDYTVDERRDPIASTRAAARLLKRNFEELGNWPMAIIAYNYGLGGMKRAKRRMGGELVNLINGYKSRLFGFASRNFYSEFLAALTITNNISKYFGKVKVYPPLDIETLTLKNYISINALSKYLKVEKQVIQEYNPALRLPVLKSEKLVPKGYILNLPIDKEKRYKELLASIPKNLLKSNQIFSDWYRIMPGDTLSKISRQFRTTIASLVTMNNVSEAGKIYSGQLLKIHGKRNVSKEIEKVKSDSLSNRQ